jgi:hypothetical protein
MNSAVIGGTPFWFFEMDLSDNAAAFSFPKQQWQVRRLYASLFE